MSDLEDKMRHALRWANVVDYDDDTVTLCAAVAEAEIDRVLRQASSGPLLCANCAKPMSDHTALAHCRKQEGQ